ncbi:uncharacterized protein LOC133383035 isoform X5 [Rhineura floridana]|uniref:uncharacterized protein LOC133383035 isoform X5 n=1 Tax=Rhineura floridana TaxID=261503 RepID=UPI002AC7F4D2|nr:uncharacterized protein LOC133383035 isoform X5 [Rhineura floridana]
MSLNGYSMVAEKGFICNYPCCCLSRFKGSQLLRRRRLVVLLASTQLLLGLCGIWLLLHLQHLYSLHQGPTLRFRRRQQFLLLTTPHLLLCHLCFRAEVKPKETGDSKDKEAAKKKRVKP